MSQVMPLALTTFLERRGFHRDPFDTYRAEREGDLLPAWFLRSPLFETVIGEPSRPESCLLFAPTGHGKTSHRIEMARRVQERLTAPALAVALTDFSGVLGAGAPQADLEYYIAQIRLLVIESLAAQLSVSVERLRQLQADANAYAGFCALLAIWAPTWLASFLVPAGLDSHAQAWRQQQHSPRRWLEILVGLARSAGFASIYVLIDGVDEWHETRDDPALQARLLAPLLNAAGVLDSEGLAFKFFLPSGLRDTLIEQRIGRLDILRAHMLAWKPADLTAMLELRLGMCSQRSQTSQGSTRSFSDLCAADFDVDHHLALAAGCSPRRMLQLARAIIERHMEGADDPDAPIAAATVLEVAPHPLQVGASVLPGPPQPVARPQPVAPPPPPPFPIPVEAAMPPLFVDPRGDIWIGELRRTERLPKLRQRCLEYLWANRHRRVSSRELIEEVYRDDPDPSSRADPAGSLRKLIRELRKVLEPEQTNSHSYIDDAIGYGYLLRNYRDER
jgi:hypothetical protein